MASILKVGDNWRALIRRKGYPSQCKTFAVKAKAVEWARGIEAAIDAGAPLPSVSELTISQVIAAYRRLRGASRPIADTSTEHYVLQILDRGLGHLGVFAITPQDLVGYAAMRRDEDGAGPYTINMDISKLGTVLRYGGVALNKALPDIVGASRPLLTHLRLIGGGGLRERRPAEDEMARILDYITERRGLVYAEAIVFAAHSAMRRGEVCAFKKSDVDRVKRIVPLMRKHPRKGKVLELVPLLGDAWLIMERQPDSADGRVFPIQPGTLTKYFTEACRALSIPDLQLRDMRHEGASKMFEQGYDIPQVALVTGHKKWETLKRYTNLKPEDLTTPPTSGKSRDGRQRPDSPRTSSRRRGRS